MEPEEKNRTAHDLEEQLLSRMRELEERKAFYQHWAGVVQGWMRGRVDLDKLVEKELRLEKDEVEMQRRQKALLEEGSRIRDQISQELTREFNQKLTNLALEHTHRQKEMEDEYLAKFKRLNADYEARGKDMQEREALLEKRLQEYQTRVRSMENEMASAENESLERWKATRERERSEIQAYLAAQADLAGLCDQMRRDFSSVVAAQEGLVRQINENAARRLEEQKTVQEQLDQGIRKAVKDFEIAAAGHKEHEIWLEGRLKDYQSKIEALEKELSTAQRAHFERALEERRLVQEQMQVHAAAQSAMDAQLAGLSEEISNLAKTQKKIIDQSKNQWPAELAALKEQLSQDRQTHTARFSEFAKTFEGLVDRSLEQAFAGMLARFDAQFAKKLEALPQDIRTIAPQINSLANRLQDLEAFKKQEPAAVESKFKELMELLKQKSLDQEVKAKEIGDAMAGLRRQMETQAATMNEQQKLAEKKAEQFEKKLVLGSIVAGCGMALAVILVWFFWPENPVVAPAPPSVATPPAVDMPKNEAAAIAPEPVVGPAGGETLDPGARLAVQQIGFSLEVLKKHADSKSFPEVSKAIDRALFLTRQKRYVEAMRMADEAIYKLLFEDEGKGSSKKR